MSSTLGVCHRWLADDDGFNVLNRGRVIYFPSINSSAPSLCEWACGPERFKGRAQGRSTSGHSPQLEKRKYITLNHPGGERAQVSCRPRRICS